MSTKQHHETPETQKSKSDDWPAVNEEERHMSQAIDEVRHRLPHADDNLSPASISIEIFLAKGEFHPEIEDTKSKEDQHQVKPENRQPGMTSILHRYLAGWWECCQCGTPVNPKLSGNVCPVECHQRCDYYCTVYT